MLCHDPIAPKLTNYLGPWKWAFSRPGTWCWEPWRQFTYSTIQLFAEQTLKISVYFRQQIKSYSIFTARQTDTHLTSLYAQVRFFSIWKFILSSIHYIPLFASLTHSLCLWRKTFMNMVALRSCSHISSLSKMGYFHLKLFLSGPFWY